MSNDEQNSIKSLLLRGIMPNESQVIGLLVKLEHLTAKLEVPKLNAMTADEIIENRAVSVKRYDILQSNDGEQTYSIESEDGYYVTFKDYEKLLGEIARLREDNDTLHDIIETPHKEL